MDGSATSSGAIGGAGGGGGGGGSLDVGYDISSPRLPTNARVQREVMRMVEQGKLHVCPWCPPGYYHAHRLLKVGGTALCIDHAAKARRMLDRPMWRIKSRCVLGCCYIFDHDSQLRFVSIDNFWGRNV